ncbi:CASP7 [Bugula neritina]|uniref:CASP7 n=1 Tax=Bugula neritina TaxID=10212 RepID=A0A7J7JAV4_BUGNE|nr:CASP7 [Bugula neritina]
MANFMGQGTVPVSQASSAATSLQTTSQLPPKIENYNFMTDVDFKYKMSHSQRGVAVIINNEEFDPDLEITDRPGSRKDEQSLIETFYFLGFEEVLVRRNLNAEPMVSFLKEVAKRDFTNSDCVMVAVLSHGTAGALYACDKTMGYNRVFAPFRDSPTLKGKPKIFIMQAERGDDTDPMMQIQFDAVPTAHNQPKALVISKESDVFVAHSTADGYLVWRDNQLGSWFIQSFCQVMTKDGQRLEIHELMARVNQMVAYTCTLRALQPQYNKAKQCPYFTSTLTKSLVFSQK